MSVTEREAPVVTPIEEREMLKVKALQFINRVRAARDLNPLDDLPKGCRRGASACVIANGLHDCADEGVTVNRNYVTLYNSVAFGGEPWTTVKIDDRAVSRFIADFDSGEYPELTL